eukprot:5466508-Pleurochrysis_carterae.AAC.2
MPRHEIDAKRRARFEVNRKKTNQGSPPVKQEAIPFTPNDPYGRYVHNAKLQELTYIALKHLAEKSEVSPIKRARRSDLSKPLYRYKSLKHMLRLANLEHRSVAGDGNCAYYAHIAGCK